MRSRLPDETTTRLTHAEYTKVIRACLPPTPGPPATSPVDIQLQLARADHAHRNAAMVALGYCCGLSAMELICLETTDYDQRCGDLWIHGGSFTDRTLTLIGSPKAILELWLRRHLGVRLMFYGFGPMGRVTPGRRLGDTTPTDIVSDLAKSVLGRSVGFAELRQSFKRQLVAQGMPPRVIADLMGTRSRRTRSATARDIRLRQQAVSNIHEDSEVGFTVGGRSI